MSADDPSPRRSRRRTLRIFFRVVFLGALLVGLLALVAGFGAFLVYDHITQPSPGGERMAFTVPEGATGQRIGQLLADEGFIEHEIFFRLAIHIDGAEPSIMHGAYLLPKEVSATQLLRLLDAAPNADLPVADPVLRVTIPEGLTIVQIAQRTDDAEAFLVAAASPELIERLDVEVDSLEGFLMPNTYFFSEPPAQKELVDRMLEQFEKEYASLADEYGEMTGAEKLRIVTVASLVEEEARIDEERAVVASVIYNRIEKNMPLEMDSTLQFALGKYGERLLNEDKEVDSPYNTYKNRGLPPGPISNPGVASIRAAFWPAETDYLFFVSNADGRTHTFTSNLRDHNRAVALYRREIHQQRRKKQH